MKVLVIPDIHLKPWMFQRAAKIMEQGTAERAVCLMDIPDDWNQEYNINLYVETLTRQSRLQRNTRRPSGHMAIMISVIYGTSGKADTVFRRRRLYRKR